MAVRKVDIDEFLRLSKQHTVFDVRSPSEYAQAHMPVAHSLPLFTDEERKVVGTTYKQQSREAAIKIGLDYFGTKMRSMLEQAEEIINKSGNKTVLVHCWRGGMRSAGVAWLLDLYGYNVLTLAGGYKAYRNWVLAQFDKPYSLRILGGYTGSGKTEVLQQLQKQGELVIDLEAIAGHRGSAFGDIDGIVQPRPEMFENILAGQLHDAAMQQRPIWVEDESQRIGLVNMPLAFWSQMRRSPVFFLDIPFDERLRHIIEGYGKMDRAKIINAIMRIKKRLGGLEVKNAVNFLLEDDIVSCFAILLRYYDKQYEAGLVKRTNLKELLHTIQCDIVDSGPNSKKILTESALAPYERNNRN